MESEKHESMQPPAHGANENAAPRARAASARSQKVRRVLRLVTYGSIAGLAILASAMLVEHFSHSASTLDTTKAESWSDRTPASFAYNVTQVTPPMTATIFGERIPLENWDVRERFEREFYYNFNNADQLLLDWKRAQRLFPIVEQELTAAQLPTDFKYLAIAESGLRNIKSPANANGFWQFIPGTAQLYGLRVDDMIDERLDPQKATDAAIKYFQKMKSTLPTWTLVAAGYNMGEDNVHQAMDWQHQNSYWNLFLNEETMRYVLRIAAIKEIFENGEKYGLNFTRTLPFKNAQAKTIVVTGPVASISDWAHDQGYAYKDVKIFNPWIIGRALPAGQFSVRLPASDEDRTTTANP